MIGWTTWACSPSTRSTSGERVSRSTRATCAAFGWWLYSSPPCRCTTTTSAPAARAACACASRFGASHIDTRPLAAGRQREAVGPERPGHHPDPHAGLGREDDRPAALALRSGTSRCARPRPARAGRRCAPGRRSPGRGCGWTRSCSRRSRTTPIQRRDLRRCREDREVLRRLAGRRERHLLVTQRHVRTGDQRPHAGEHRVEVVPLPATGPVMVLGRAGPDRVVPEQVAAHHQRWRSRRGGRRPRRSGRGDRGDRRRQRRARRRPTAPDATGAGDVSACGVPRAAARAAERRPARPPRAPDPTSDSDARRGAAGCAGTPVRMGGMDRGPSALSPEARIRALGSLPDGAAPTSSTCSSSAAVSSAPASRSTR